MSQGNPVQEAAAQLKASIAQITQATNSAIRLRACVESAFKLSSDYPNVSEDGGPVSKKEDSSESGRRQFPSDEDETEVFYRRIQEKLIQVQAEYEDLDKISEVLMQKKNQQLPQEDTRFNNPFYTEPSNIHSCLNTIETNTNIDLLAQLSLDATHDSSQLYLEILHAYQWNTRLRENCQLTFLYAQQNSTKRWSSASNHISGRRRPHKNLGTPGNHTFKSSEIYEHMRKLVGQLQAIFSGLVDAKLHPVNQYVSLVNSNSRILEVSVQNTMRVFLVLRGYLVENIVVRGLDEPRCYENGDIDLQTPTRYKVFRHVNNNATAAMQYYVFPTGSFDTNLKTLLAWLRSYKSLFTEKCRKCQKFFDKEGVVPTWRDFKVLTAYHDGCRSLNQ